MVIYPHDYFSKTNSGVNEYRQLGKMYDAAVTLLLIEKINFYAIPYLLEKTNHGDSPCHYKFLLLFRHINTDAIAASDVIPAKIPIQDFIFIISFSLIKVVHLF